MSKAERRRRAYKKRQERREPAGSWTCRHGDEWPGWTPIGLCGCLRPDIPTPARGE